MMRARALNLPNTLLPFAYRLCIICLLPSMASQLTREGPLQRAITVRRYYPIINPRHLLLMADVLHPN